MSENTGMRSVRAADPYPRYARTYSPNISSRFALGSSYYYRVSHVTVTNKLLDTYVAKYDNNGYVLWTLVYGGSGNEVVSDCVTRSDGSVVIVGSTTSTGGDKDAFYVKYSSTGTLVSRRTYGYGSTVAQEFFGVTATADGGHVAVGRVIGSVSKYLAVAVKFSSSGSVLWQRTYGNNDYDLFYDAVEGASSDVVCVGVTNSWGSGESDILVVRYSSAGAATSIRAIGSAYGDLPRRIVYVNTGGYLMVGYRQTTSGGLFRPFMLKITAGYVLDWAFTVVGGTGNDYASDVIATSDGGFLMTGYSTSVGIGGTDIFLYKMTSAGAKQWAMAYGTTSNDDDPYVAQTSDGGYLLSFGKYLLKLDSNGVCKTGCIGQRSLSWSNSAWTPTFVTVGTGYSVVSSLSAYTPSWTYTTMTSSSSRTCYETTPSCDVPLSSQTGCCSAPVGAPYKFRIASNTFTDDDGDVLTYTKSGPSWLTFSNSEFTAIPPLSAVGTYTIQLSVVDSTGYGASSSYSLTVTPSLFVVGLNAVKNCTEDTDCHLPASVSSPSSAINVTMVISNTSLASLSTQAYGDAFSMYSATTGIWRVISNETTLTSILNDLSIVPAVGMHGDLTVAIYVTDSFGQKTTGTWTVTIQPVNDAPVIDSLAVFVLNDIQEDEIGNVGNSVASIVNDDISDQDGIVKAIAVVSCDVTHGDWQYSMNLGSTWTNIMPVSDISALLLDSLNRVRFVPRTNYNGQSSVQFRAWDKSSGVASSKVDVSVNGGASAFSAQTATATITISAVNDAPVLNVSLFVLPDVVLGDTNVTAYTVVSVIGSEINDVDVNSVCAIAVLSTVDKWQYYDSAQWLDIEPVNDTSCLLLDGLKLIRVVPTSTGTLSLSFRAWDKTSGVTGTRIDCSNYGGSSSFSEQVGTIRVIVSNPSNNNDENTANVQATEQTTTQLAGSAAVTGAVSFVWWIIKRRIDSNKVAKRDKQNPVANRIRTRLDLESLESFDKNVDYEGFRFSEAVSNLVDAIRTSGVRVDMRDGVRTGAMIDVIVDSIEQHVSIIPKKKCMCGSYNLLDIDEFKNQSGLVLSDVVSWDRRGGSIISSVGQSYSGSLRTISAASNTLPSYNSSYGHSSPLPAYDDAVEMQPIAPPHDIEK